MVVAGILALALALPTGALFGIGYGTGVRIGYEQIYPLLFPANAKGERNTSTTVNNVKQINSIYNAIGGKEASQMGIAVGLSSAMGELDTNPDFQDLLQLELALSGNTSSSLNKTRTRFGLDDISQSGDSYSDAQQDLAEKIIQDSPTTTGSPDIQTDLNTPFRNLIAQYNKAQLIFLLEGSTSTATEKAIILTRLQQFYDYTPERIITKNEPGTINPATPHLIVKDQQLIDFRQFQSEYGAKINTLLTELSPLTKLQSKNLKVTQTQLKHLQASVTTFYKYIGLKRNSSNVQISLQAHQLYKTRHLTQWQQFINKLVLAGGLPP